MGHQLNQLLVQYEILSDKNLVCYTYAKVMTLKRTFTKCPEISGH